tara:strand:+ start:2108 stop:2836 length:729 start_codon:yes stop_codon:yes gene_type:complete
MINKYITGVYTMRELKDIINESFSKEYGYKIKVARDCSADDLAKLESILSKYNIVSATPWNRQPIQENPMEFQRLKGVNFTSEVCSTDVVLKYPVNDRILEVYVAVNLGVDHERVLCYGIKEPRKIESDLAAERHEMDKDRFVSEEDAELNKEEFAHYENENVDVDFSEALFGEEYNSKFLAELEKIKAEKGADYFRNYPSKDEIMGDSLKGLYDTITGTAGGGKSPEPKHVDVISQSARRN